MTLSPTSLVPLMTSKSGNWLTPPTIIERVSQAFHGTIDLDPCSNDSESPNVPAITCWDGSNRNGLTEPWFGRVYCNPPYGRDIFLWTEKAYYEYLGGNSKEIILLVPARTDTAWFRPLWDNNAMCFIRGRLKFSNKEWTTPSGSKNSAPFPSVLIHMGINHAAFDAAFSKIGHVIFPESKPMTYYTSSKAEWYSPAASGPSINQWKEWNSKDGSV